MEIDTTPSTSNVDQTVDKKLTHCEVCSVALAKYTCPKCEVRTCCLKCSSIHKKELECSGIRDRTKFVPMNKFTNLDLSSDYRLLEEITRNFEVIKKDLTRYRRFDDLPHYLLRLKKAAYARQINLKFLPPSFERRKVNSTKLKGCVINWHLDWVFVNADNLKFSDEAVPETEKLSSVLDKYLNEQEDKVLQERMQFYQASGLPALRILLKAEQKKGKKYYELDPEDSIRDNLRGKMIIEYPIIHVMMRDHAIGLDVIDSDNEDEQSAIDGGLVIDKMLKNAESDESIYNSLKNLLFVSGDEMSE
ncbi:PREDICTED: box C/D snoRNA protein 1 [Nicrophorus vespilloides]|uniref:Box C/D snoRNA protein 1 n=1 Tax=Nicrophorus vespilloides TaxID=110193 RepID=A0ABM1N6H3_NICVS|nr:PREDICTED: box C/D snoRNA protein 1 [Nicrophorus vespilloides]